MTWTATTQKALCNRQSFSSSMDSSVSLILDLNPTQTDGLYDTESMFIECIVSLR